MKNRTLILFVVSFVLYTIVDILLWQRIFEIHELWEFIPQYKKGWFMVLALVMTTGAIALGDAKNAAWFICAMWLSAWTGLEDILYYVLDGKNLPEYYHWLEGSWLFLGYDRQGVLVTDFLWQVVILGSFFWIKKWRPFN